MRRGRTRGPTRGRSRGQALVEFALVIFPFLLTIFGTVEFALIVASIGTYNFAVRDATRLGTLLSRSDNTADQQVIQVATAHISGIVMAIPYEIDIYRATSDGLCLNAQVSPPAQNPPLPPVLEVPVDDPTCAKGVYQPSGSTWVLTNGATGGPWLVANRNDSLQNADYLGVRILYRYTFLTGFVGVIGSTMNLSATSSQRIEPQDFSTSDRAPAPASPSAAPVASAPLLTAFGQNGQHSQNGVGA
ncbi:MAG TPA: TadE/TadG family type IV pilus assembly protein [Ktedonobacterales bacterium]|nr:TadE/TadG family type IV pilus assembly protein [Ktedonobacterales bacterium]